MAAGLVTLLWHDDAAHQLRLAIYAASAAQMAGGVAIQFRRGERTGAALLVAGYLTFALLCIPRIVTAPRIYVSWGDFFEQFSMVAGAAIAFGCTQRSWPSATVARIGQTLLGICVASFTIEQALYLDATATLVPKWVPPSQLFWAIATTVAFGLAAASLLLNRMTLLGARLLTAMIALFGLLVWVPLIVADPHSHTNWSEGAETFAIAGAVWILADLLGKRARR